MYTFEIASELTAPPEQVWRHVTRMEGVNGELMPLMRMTVPAGLGGATLDDLPLRQRAGRSWLLLFGVLPVDYDDLMIVERGPGPRFVEESTMLTQAHWRHERTVESVDGGSRIVDRLSWRGRIRPLGALYGLAVPVLFRHRHARLRRKFGAP